MKTPSVNRLLAREHRDRVSHQALQREFMQRFVLGFISANGSKTKTESSRAKAAVRALLGEIPANFSARVSDEELLTQMALLCVNMPSGPARKRTSSTHLAEVVTKTLPASIRQTTVSRIRKVFEKERRARVAALNDGDNVTEQLVREGLWEMENLLRRFGVTFFAEQ
jgi:hypothetical protein